MFDTIIHKWLRVPYALHVHTNQGPKRPRATVLFIHGMGNSGGAWEEVIAGLPEDLHVITIDLLGFGKSPRPSWAVYSAKTQARSVIATLVQLRLNRPVVIVGHSLGALVAVEVAKRYPLIVKSLVLCSPPFYKSEKDARGVFPSSDRMLRRMFRYGKDHPERMIQISELAMKYGLVNKAFRFTHDDIETYMAALESSIINQTSLEDAKRLRKPMTIIHGRFDPVVIGRNLRELANGRKRITRVSVLGSHEIQGRFIPAVIKAIDTQTAKKPRRIQLKNPLRPDSKV